MQTVKIVHSWHLNNVTRSGHPTEGGLMLCLQIFLLFFLNAYVYFFYWVIKSLREAMEKCVSIQTSLLCNKTLCFKTTKSTIKGALKDPALAVLHKTRYSRAKCTN
jgi:hypothetical protein